MSLITEYKKAFQTGLELFGFKKMKGTNCFGKLINNEILLYVLIKKCSPPDRGKKAFDIISGVQTIYSYDLSEYQLGLSGISLICYNTDTTPYVHDVNFIYDETSLSAVIDKALKQTVDVAIPVLLDVNNLKTSLDFLIKYKLGMLYPVDTFFRDSVLLIITNNHDTFEDRINWEDKIATRIYSNDPTNEAYINYMKQIKEIIRNDLVKSRDRVWASRKLQEELYKEVNRRVENNKKTLIQYGVLV